MTPHKKYQRTSDDPPSAVRFTAADRKALREYSKKNPPRAWSKWNLGRKTESKPRN